MILYWDIDYEHFTFPHGDTLHAAPKTHSKASLEVHRGNSLRESIHKDELDAQAYREGQRPLWLRKKKEIPEKGWFDSSTGIPGPSGHGISWL